MIQAFRIVIILDYYFLKNWGAKMWQLLHVTQGAERGGLPNPKNQVVNTIFLVQWPHDRCAWRKGLNKNSECEVKTLRGRRGNWGQVTSTDAIHLAFCLCIRIHLGPSFSTFCLSGIPPPISRLLPSPLPLSRQTHPGILRKTPTLPVGYLRNCDSDSYSWGCQSDCIHSVSYQSYRKNYRWP